MILFPILIGIVFAVGALIGLVATADSLSDNNPGGAVLFLGLSGLTGSAAWWCFTEGLHL